MKVPAIKEAGDSALLLELEPVIDPDVNSRAIGIAAAVRDAVIPGVREVVSTYRSVAVCFDPLIADIRDVHACLGRALQARVPAVHGSLVEIPVEYGGQWGPDLREVADFGGLSTDAVIKRHCEREYRVFMLGFLPGFAYLGSVDAAIAAPRKSTPRERVRAGSVAIAGAQTAVYPSDSPGGWQIIGHTATRMFNAAQWPAALLSPGDSVRFRAEPHGARPDVTGMRPGAQSVTAARSMSIIDPGLLTTVQDGGRWGHQSSGVPVCGAMDWIAYRTANALVGNEPGAAVLEATVAGPKLRFEQRTTFAVAGADLGATVDGVRVPHCTAVSCPAGGVLRFGNRLFGARAYLAVDGGIEVPRVLASRSTHVLSRMGGWHGRALMQGDRLALGGPGPAPRRRRPTPEATAYVRGGGARVRVIPGPQSEYFPADALETLERTRFIISPQSNRMGYRLQGGRIPRLVEQEMISDAAFIGAIQVPSSGEPILLMADHQTTGGYPQLAVVITADVPLVAQLSPGDWIEFRVCSRSEALSALVAQEARLLAFD
jgi:antagonist of KipI